MLIDADKYREFLNTYPLEKAQRNFMTFYRDALQYTFECEVKDVAERKKGKWIKRGEHLYMCECGRFSTVKENYCPSCGLDMREEKTDAH